MTSKESLIVDLDGLKFTHLVEFERNVVESLYHKVLGAIVQVMALKEI